jgi:hypothetical protein
MSIRLRIVICSRGICSLTFRVSDEEKKNPTLETAVESQVSENHKPWGNPAHLGHLRTQGLQSIGLQSIYTDFLDTEAKQLERGHEHNMPCRRAIELARDRVKKLVAENRFSSQARSNKASVALRQRPSSVQETQNCQESRSWET